MTLLSWGRSSVAGGALEIATAAGVPSLCDEAWHHIALVHFPGSTSAFLDGALGSPGGVNGGLNPRVAYVQAQAYSIASDGSASLSVGWNGVTRAGQQLFAGALAEVRIYSRALTANEVIALSQPPLGAVANAAVLPPVPLRTATFYSFSCAAGAAGAPASLVKSSADNSWAWATAGAAAPICVPCLAGFYAPQAASACLACPPGTYSLAGAATCLLCPAGTYGDRAGLTSSSCSGACPGCASGSTNAALLACGPGNGRAVPASSGLLLWPAAHPKNPAKVDLVVADIDTCTKLTKNCPSQSSTAQQIVGPDGARRFVVGAAADFNMQAPESMTCSVRD
jgi:hypothetical protein